MARALPRSRYDDYGGKKKSQVRREIWDAAFEDIVGQSATMSDIKYLCLPSNECLYLQELVERNLSLKNVVAAERDEDKFYSIKRFFRGHGAVRRGLIEDLILDGQIESKFPFDVINMDFCGGGFHFPDLDRLDSSVADSDAHMRKFKAIFKCMETQWDRKYESWYLLLTLGCTRNRNHMQFLENRLGKIREHAENSIDWEDSQPLLIQHVVPYVLADKALDVGYIPNRDTFLSYRYIEEGKSSTMAVWRLRFDIMKHGALSRSGGGVTEEKNKCLMKFCKAYYTEEKLQEI